MRIVEEKIKTFDAQVESHKKNILGLELNTGQKNDLLKKIDDYSIGDNLFKPERVNYWYNLKINPSNFKISDIVSGYEQIYYGHMKIDFFEINLDYEKDIWIIKKNNIKLKTIRFSTSKGMKYLVYLYKHYSDGKTIEFEKLEEIIENWGSKKKLKGSGKFKNISNNLYNLFKSEPELLPIKDAIILREKEGCFFHSIDTVNIVLGEFYVPDPW